MPSSSQKDGAAAQTPFLFSTSLRLAQENSGYLAPSAQCIRPPKMQEEEPQPQLSLMPTRALETTRREEGHFMEEKSEPSAVDGVIRKRRGGPLKITLEDCLACSGCVTSAETVLVESQSMVELEKAVKNLCEQRCLEGAKSPFLWYVSISEASAVSLASYWGLPVNEAYELLAGFVTNRLEDWVRQANPQDEGQDLGASYGMYIQVSNLNWANQFSRLKVCEEYEERVRMEREACLPCETEQEKEGEAQRTAQGSQGNGRPCHLPLIVSACPGWGCYCEKQGGPELLKLLSTVASAQGVAGCYVKRAWVYDLPWKKSVCCAEASTTLEATHSSPDELRSGAAPWSTVYHISIQPCFDKKLEAARDQLQLSPAEAAAYKEAHSPAKMILYTDCVLTTVEVLHWMEENESQRPRRRRLDGPQPIESRVPAASEEVGASSNAVLEQVRLMGSGGYPAQLLNYLWQKGESTTLTSPDTPTLLRWLLDRSCGGDPNSSAAMKWVTQRNRNRQLLTAHPPLSSLVSSPRVDVCIAYGFQHIQNVVRQLKKEMGIGVAGKVGGSTGSSEVAEGVHALRDRLLKVRQRRHTSSSSSGLGGVRDAKTTPTGALRKESALGSCALIELMACPDACWNGGGQIHESRDEKESKGMDSDSGDAFAEEPVLRGVLRAAQEAWIGGGTASALPDASSSFFSLAGLLGAEKQPWSGGKLFCRCVWKDRQAEYEALVNEGGVVSLGW